MRESWVAFVSGVIFAIGLGVAGMTQPAKVTAFLNVFGSASFGSGVSPVGPMEWDPSLALVMVGAIAVYSLGFRLSVRRVKPLVAECFHLPSPQAIDKKLISGAALFGLGWGLSGFCPGPALTSLVSLQNEALVFVLAMVAGMIVFEWSQGKAKA